MKTLRDIHKAIGLKDIEGADKVSILDPDIIPRPDQLNNLKCALYYKRSGDFSDAGIGKSLTSYMYLLTMVLLGKRITVITTSGTIQQYFNNLRRIFDTTSIDLKVLNLSDYGTPKTRKLAINEAENVQVLAASIAIARIEAQFLDGFNADIVIFDEAQYLKSTDSDIHKLVARLVSGGKMLHLMTATPSETTPKDAYGLIRLKTPTAYSSERQFDRMHTITEDIKRKITTKYGVKKLITVKDVSGYKNLNLIQKNLYINACRTLKEEVLDLEKPNIIPIDVTLDKKHKKLIQELIDERIIELSDGDIVPALHTGTLNSLIFQMCIGPEMFFDTKIKNNVMARVDEELASIGVRPYSKNDYELEGRERNKVIIFAYHRNVVEYLYKKYEKLNPALIYGDSDTESNKNKFIEDDTCRMNIIQHQAGGEGLDGMQRVCSDIIILEPFGSPGKLDQAVSRLLRNGQKKVVNVRLVKPNIRLYHHRYDVMLGRVKDLAQVDVKVSQFLKGLSEVY